MEFGVEKECGCLGGIFMVVFLSVAGNVFLSVLCCLVLVVDKDKGV